MYLYVSRICSNKISGMLHSLNDSRFVVHIFGLVRIIK